MLGFQQKVSRLPAVRSPFSASKFTQGSALVFDGSHLPVIGLRLANPSLLCLTFARVRECRPLGRFLTLDQLWCHSASRRAFTLNILCRTVSRCLGWPTFGGMASAKVGHCAEEGEADPRSSFVSWLRRGSPQLRALGVL